MVVISEEFVSPYWKPSSLFKMEAIMKKNEDWSQSVLLSAPYTCEEGTLIEESSVSNWPVDMSLGYFLDC